jgi:hypothetical protein
MNRVQPSDIQDTLLKGITADPEEMSTRKRPESIDPAFCQRIALVRQLCNIEFERPGWEELH